MTAAEPLAMGERVEGARAEPIHTLDCDSWGCVHCQVCGVGVLYGSRCRDHPTPGSSGAVARSGGYPSSSRTPHPYGSHGGVMTAWLRRLLRRPPRGHAGATVVSVLGPGLVNYHATLTGGADEANAAAAAGRDGGRK